MSILKHCYLWVQVSHDMSLSGGSTGVGILVQLVYLQSDGPLVCNYLELTIDTLYRDVTF